MLVLNIDHLNGAKAKYLLFRFASNFKSIYTIFLMSVKVLTHDVYVYLHPLL